MTYHAITHHGVDSPMTARIYCFANQKGGVAKTTTAVNLGAYVAASGRRVLLVDTDPQSNATTSLGINPRTLKTSLYDVLIDGRPVQEALTLTEWMNLDLLPSSTDLAGAEVEMAGVMARERLLARSLAPVAEKYDYIFIDEPPSLGLLTINGLTAATHGVVIPVQCEYLALEGLSLLLNTIRQVREILNDRLVIAGVVLTMYDARTNLGQDVVDEVRRYFPNESLSDHHPAQHPSERSALARQDDPELCAVERGRDGLSGAGAGIYLAHRRRPHRR
jgi:chromosome partitioning protein